MSSPPTPGLDGATVLVTGGAGFVGSAIALATKRSNPGAKVVVLDNLRRAGSELRPPELQAAGIEFIRGDIRNPADLALAKRPVDLIVECSAEPSVLAGYAGSPRDVIETNLVGTMNCLELARERKSRVLFLSTSRVYPTTLVNQLEHAEDSTRYTLRDTQRVPGASKQGISEAFPMTGTRTFYGMTKLASEMLLEEYAAGYGLDFVTLRFGVISGPGQMGKVDQGVFALWMARHLWGASLTYKGWGGTGKQVRDVVHIDDVVDLVERVHSKWNALCGKTLNAGGGNGVSSSLLEATSACEEITGRKLKHDTIAETHHSDVRIYLTDQSALTALTAWRPTRGVKHVFADLYEWMRGDEKRLRPILGG